MSSQDVRRHALSAEGIEPLDLTDDDALQKVSADLTRAALFQSPGILPPGFTASQLPPTSAELMFAQLSYKPLPDVPWPSTQVMEATKVLANVDVARLLCAWEVFLARNSDNERVRWLGPGLALPTDWDYIRLNVIIRDESDPSTELGVDAKVGNWIDVEELKRQLQELIPGQPLGSHTEIQASWSLAPGCPQCVLHDADDWNNARRHYESHLQLDNESLDIQVLVPSLSGGHSSSGSNGISDEGNSEGWGSSTEGGLTGGLQGSAPAVSWKLLHQRFSRAELDNVGDSDILPDDCLRSHMREAVPLGRGTSGTVYRATAQPPGDLGEGRAVLAVKVIPIHSTCVEIAQRELEIASYLHHPNVVKYHGCYFASETAELMVFFGFASAGSLLHLIQRLGPPPGYAFRSMGRQIFTALTYMHSLGIAHRDIKPGNFLVRAEDGCVMLSDFGTATLAGEECFSDFQGTPLYSAPEVRRSDGRSGIPADVWSAGCTLAELLSGMPPCPLPAEGSLFGGGTAMTANAVPPGVMELLPQEAANFFSRCFAFDPALRGTAEQLLHHPFLGDWFDFASV